jgi:hypothetical protein
MYKNISFYFFLVGVDRIELSSLSATALQAAELTTLFNTPIMQIVLISVLADNTDK